MLKWEDKFTITGRGDVYTMRYPGEFPYKVGDTVELESVGKIVIKGIERYMKLMHPPILSENIGLLVTNALR